MVLPIGSATGKTISIFSILASFLIFARVRILSRFFASYRGICTAKRYETVVAFWRFAHLLLLFGSTGKSQKLLK
jgi:hypothetical protein